MDSCGGDPSSDSVLAASFSFSAPLELLTSMGSLVSRELIGRSILAEESVEAREAREADEGTAWIVLVGTASPVLTLRPGSIEGTRLTAGGRSDTGTLLASDASTDFSAGWRVGCCGIGLGLEGFGVAVAPTCRGVGFGRGPTPPLPLRDAREPSVRLAEENENKSEFCFPRADTAPEALFRLAVFLGLGWPVAFPSGTLGGTAGGGGEGANESGVWARFPVSALAPLPRRLRMDLNVRFGSG